MIYKPTNKQGKPSVLSPKTDKSKMDKKANSLISGTGKKALFLLGAISLVLLGYLLGTNSHKSRDFKGWQQEEEAWEFSEDHDDDHEDRDDHDDDDDDDDHRKHKTNHRRKGKRHYRDRRMLAAKKISAAQAQQIAAKSLPKWRVKEGWLRKTEDGGIELMVPLKFHGKIIGEINLDPVTGAITKSEVRVKPEEAKISAPDARKIVAKALERFTIGSDIRLGRRGNYWEVPVLYNGLELEELMIGARTGSILPDWDIEEEFYYSKGKKPPPRKHRKKQRE